MRIKDITIAIICDFLDFGDKFVWGITLMGFLLIIPSLILQNLAICVYFLCVPLIFYGVRFVCMAWVIGLDNSDKILRFVVRWLLWPIIMLEQGYHDTNEGSRFISMALAISTVIPFGVVKIVITIAQNHLLFYSTISVIGFYLIWGLVVNLFARDFWGEGFI
jgi:hypothetical protein